METAIAQLQAVNTTLQNALTQIRETQDAIRSIRTN